MKNSSKKQQQQPAGWPFPPKGGLTGPLKVQRQKKEEPAVKDFGEALF